MPRYVLLHHELPPSSDRASHWDFMLEHEGVLSTWMLESLPQLWREQLRLTQEVATNDVPARRLADHRPTYLEYEGEVSGDRGNVTRIARGMYSITTLNTDLVKLQLAGVLHGPVILTRRNESDEEWKLKAEREEL